MTLAPAHIGSIIFAKGIATITTNASNITVENCVGSGSYEMRVIRLGDHRVALTYHLDAPMTKDICFGRVGGFIQPMLYYSGAGMFPKRLLKIFVGLMAFSFATILAVLTPPRLAYRDPFIQYRSIMPEQLSTSLKYYPCKIPKDDDTTEYYCVFSREKGIFDQISVQNSHVIKRIEFRVRHGSLYLGDLMLCWGKSIEVRSNRAAELEGRLLELQWNAYLDAFVDLVQSRYGGRISYSLPILYIEIQREPISCNLS